MLQTTALAAQIDNAKLESLHLTTSQMTLFMTSQAQEALAENAVQESDAHLIMTMF